MNLLETVRSLFREPLSALLNDPQLVEECLEAVRPAQNLELADYQANFAMRLGKALGKKPTEIAAAIVEKLPTRELESASVAGPGFINLKLKSEFLGDHVAQTARDERLGVAHAKTKKKYVVDYSGPNVAKPLHVGHLRSTIIGDSLVRILRHLGHEVIGDNHLGDWGTQFGMLIYGYRNFVDKKRYEIDSKNRVRELARLYVLVRNLAEHVGVITNGFANHLDREAFERDPIAELSRVYINGIKRGRGDEDDESEEMTPTRNPVADAYRAETAKLHAGDAENQKLWNDFMPACMEEIHEVYHRLKIIPFDHEHGESFYQPMLASVVESLQQSGITEAGDNGSVIIRFGKSQVAVVRKSDGAFTYTTTDLATIRYRIDNWKPDAILYVVDFRQAQHFANLFEAVRKWGYTEIELSHVSFGSVLGKEGKPIKTREGGAVELHQLLEQAVELGGRKFELTYWQRKANGHDVPKWEEFSEAEKREIAETIGIGAVKYADLSQNRTSDYKFDFDKMLATDGNTATYMQYAYARCRAILRRGEVDESSLRSQEIQVPISHTAERLLALRLLKFEETLWNAATEFSPHLVTGYLWDLAKSFNGFFENCPVLTAPSEELKLGRLLLVDSTARTIRAALGLLGIGTVERM